jgi:serine/threonine-protein kinase HipA
MPLRLDVRIDGFRDPVGQLVRGDDEGLSFSYRREHLDRPDGMAVSLSLPLREEPHGDVATRAFFDNLLSEREGTLAAVMAREALARTDIAGILFHVGKDCAGALSVLPEGAPPTKVPGLLDQDYVALSDERIAAIVQSLFERRPLPDGMQDPSPLAGVQSKIALTRLPGGRLAEPAPNSGAPTTHILKVPERGQERDVDREALAMRMSRHLVATASAERADYGGVPALLVERFDRKVQHGMVTRLHQEDFAQALGLPLSLKYERRGTASKRFTIQSVMQVLNQTINPAGAKSRLLTGAIFDLIVGNVDGHAKNHAILHISRGRVDLAPRYDVLPTRLDPRFTDEFAYNIGAATRLTEVTEDEFDKFLAIFGFVTTPARRRIKQTLVRGIAHNLSQALDGIQDAGEKAFADLIASNIRQLLPVLGVEVPKAARDRDAFGERGGGWSIS